MLKQWKAGAVVTLAALLMTTGMNANAQTIQKRFSRDQLNTSKTEIAFNQQKQKKDLYKEGEVIVLYGDKTQNVQAFTSDSLGKDIEVAQTYTFDINSEDASLAKSAGSSKQGNLHFSLIKSDKYTTKQLMDMMKKRSDVKAVSPNLRLTTQSVDYSNLQWSLKEADENGGGVNAKAVNDAIKANKSDGKEKVIAIVDTGVDYTHPDLEDKMWENPYQGKIAGEHGYDFVWLDDDPIDDNGHGTHCAGIAAGNNDGQGISGVVDSDNVKIMALKMLNEDGQGFLMEEIGCYNYIYRTQQLGTNVVSINNSWGTEITEDEKMFYTQEELDMIYSCEDVFKAVADLTGQSGAITCVAAGNSSYDNDYIFAYPANVDSDYIVTVAASNDEDEMASFSNGGVRNVDIAAPGENIVSSVSYECFEPYLYTEETAKELCAYFDNFDSKTTDDLKADVSEDSISFDWKNTKVASKKNVESEITVTPEEHFGSEGKSLSVRLSGVKKSGEYIISIPFKAPNETFQYSCHWSSVGNYSEDCDNALMAPNDAIFVSIETAEVDETLETQNAMWGYLGGSGWMTETSSFDADEVGQDLRLVFSVLSVGTEDIVINLDDVAISKSDDDEFGKYAIYSGTSMATPMVTGAVAALAELYPDMTALERKDVLLGCTREGKDSVAYRTKTGCILDLTNVGNPNATVHNVEFQNDKDIVITGSHLDGATISINGQEVKPTKQIADTIVIDGKNFLNKEANISIEKNNIVKKCSVILATGKDLTKENIALDENASLNDMLTTNIGTKVVSNGSDVYVIGDLGEVYKTDEKLTKLQTVCEGMSASILGKGFEAYATTGCGFTMGYGATSLNGEIYAVASLNSDFENLAILARYTDAKGWEKVSEIPDSLMDSVMNGTLAAYKGKLYLFGGVNDSNEFISDMYCYDIKNDKWTESVELPSPRAYAKAAQYNDKLVVAFGAKDVEGNYPEILTFDGKKWTESSKEVSAVPGYNKFLLSEDDRPIYGVGSLGAKKDAIAILKDAKDDENGDGNNGEDEDYSDITEYEIYPVYTGGLVAAKDGVLLQGMLIQGIGDITMYDVNKDAYTATGYRSSNNAIGATTINDKLLAVTYDDSLNMQFYSMPIKSAMVRLNVTGADLADITQTQKEWYPSDTVSFQIKAKKGCEITSVTVAGKEVKANKDNVYAYTAPACDNLNGIKVEIKGKSNKDAKATTEAKKDTSSTQTATDAKKEVPKKNSTHKVGKLTYKVTKSDAANGTVSCIKLNNSKLTKVTVPDTVQINGYTFKVTKIANNTFKSAKKLKSLTIGANVTSIGKNVCKSCKKLTKVTIKSTKIKSFGKGCFKSINKKATIKVPKKVKKDYKKKLNKAGCKATVK